MLWGILFFTVPNLQAQSIGVDPGSLRFKVLVGSTAERAFTISNSDTITLEVSSILIDSDKFEVVGATAFAVNPNSSREVKVRFSTETTGTTTATLTVSSNDPINPQVTVSLTGRAYPLVIINELDANDSGSDDEEFIELYDGGIGGTDLSGLVVVLYDGDDSSSYASYDLDDRSTGGDGYFVLGDDVENIDWVINNFNLRNGEHAAALYFGDAAAFPNNTPVTSDSLIDAIVYSTDGSGTAQTLIDTLLNPGQPLVNENINNSNYESNQRIPNGSGGARNTNTYYQFPPTPGDVNKAPDIDVDPSSHDYGDVEVGKNESQVFQVTNEGNADLHVESTILTGSDKDEFHIDSGGGEFTVAPGASHPITVSFNPVTTGGKHAILEISSDDPDEDPFEVGLSGHGIPEFIPDIDVTPPSHDYGDVEVGHSKSKVFQVTNEGNADLHVESTILTGGDKDEFSIVGGGAFTVAPGASHPITVSFIPVTTGGKHAILEISSDDPDEDPFEVGLDGRGIAADIVVNPNSYNYLKVALDSSQASTFRVTNDGDAVLEVTKTELTGPDKDEFHIVSGGAPFDVAKGGFHDIMVSFTPQTVGLKTADLEITSNDPDPEENPYKVELKGEAIAAEITIHPESYDFGDVAVGDTSDPKSITVRNDGEADLYVRNTSIIGQDNDEFSIVSGGAPFTLAKDETHDIVMIFHPELAGEKSAVLRIENNDPDEDPFPDSLSGRGVGGPEFCGLEPSSGSATYKTDLEVTAVVCPLETGITIQNVLLYYGNYSTTRTNSLNMGFVSGNTYRTVIPGDSITEHGLWFYARATNSLDQPGFSVTAFLTTEVPVRVMPHPLPTNRWIMFTVPFDIPNVDQQKITAVLADLGPQTDKDKNQLWKIYRTDTDGKVENYFDLNALNNRGDDGKFKPGNAFWLYLSENKQVKIPTNTLRFPTMKSVPGYTTIPYNLKNGWNQVGSPYTFEISWDSVETTPSGTKDGLMVYRYGGEKFSQLAGSANKTGWTTPLTSLTDFLLLPWEGYAVNNTTGFNVTITFKPKRGTNHPASPLPKQNHATDWKLLLNAENTNRYHVAAVGMDSRASMERDNLDYISPPIIDQEYVSVVFYHPEWNSDQHHFCTDFRPIDPEGDVWYFNLLSNSNSVMFRPEGLGQIPENFQVLLVDTKYGLSYNLRETGETVLTDLFPDEYNRFALLIGTEGYVNDAAGGLDRLIPGRFRLLQNYPNPFNPETEIAYQISVPGQVQLAIYNILGQKVKTLMDGYQEAGFYRTRWDGTADTGAQIASGIYFYRLRAGTFVETRKMLKIQ